MASRTLFDEAMIILRGCGRVKHTAWLRGGQEAKINFGDRLAIAELACDLHRNPGLPE